MHLGALPFVARGPGPAQQHARGACPRGPRCCAGSELRPGARAVLDTAAAVGASSSERRKRAQRPRPVRVRVD